MVVTGVLVAGGTSALALGGPGGQAHRAERPDLASAPGTGGISGVASGAEGSLSGPSTRSGRAVLLGPTSSSSLAAHHLHGVPGVGSGLAVPAGGAPLSAGEDPAGPAGAPGSGARGPAVTLPTPAAGSLPTVAGMSRDVAPDAVVMLGSPLTPAQLVALSKLRGVSRIETVDTGTVALAGSPVVAFGIDPATFRNFTPPASASSDQLWRYVAAGSLVSSYEMAGDRSLKLGSTEVITPAASAPDSSVRGWLGAFASIGLPGVDLLVDHRYSPQLGLTPDSGLVVSAPALDGATLQSELSAALPGGAVELLHPDQLPTNLPGNTLGSVTRQKILSAALSRVGLPYVWGAAGPRSFENQ